MKPEAPTQWQLQLAVRYTRRAQSLCCCIARRKGHQLSGIGDLQMPTARTPAADSASNRCLSSAMVKGTPPASSCEKKARMTIEVEAEARLTSRAQKRMIIGAGNRPD